MWRFGRHKLASERSENLHFLPPHSHLTPPVQRTPVLGRKYPQKNASSVLLPLTFYTRKLCCRKYDRAMRPMGALNFRDSLTTPTATIPNIFYGLLFRSSLWIFLQNVKSVALPVPGIIGGAQKNWAVPGYTHAPLSPKFLMGFYSDWPCKCTHQIWSP